MNLNFDWIESNNNMRDNEILLNGRKIKYNNLLANWIEDNGEMDINHYGEKIYFISTDETNFKKTFNKSYTEFI